MENALVSISKNCKGFTLYLIPVVLEKRMAHVKERLGHLEKAMTSQFHALCKIKFDYVHSPMLFVFSYILMVVFNCCFLCNFHKFMCK